LFVIATPILFIVGVLIATCLSLWRKRRNVQEKAREEETEGGGEETTTE
jgi:hypothetical protein